MCAGLPVVDMGTLLPPTSPSCTPRCVVGFRFVGCLWALVFIAIIFLILLVCVVNFVIVSTSQYFIKTFLFNTTLRQLRHAHTKVSTQCCTCRLLGILFVFTMPIPACIILYPPCQYLLVSFCIHHDRYLVKVFKLNHVTNSSDSTISYIKRKSELAPKFACPFFPRDLLSMFELRSIM